jgi:hypothetical protein
MNCDRSHSSIIRRSYDCQLESAATPISSRWQRVVSQQLIWLCFTDSMLALLVYDSVVECQQLRGRSWCFPFSNNRSQFFGDQGSSSSTCIPWLLLFLSRPRTRRLPPQLYASRRRELLPYGVDEGRSSEYVKVGLWKHRHSVLRRYLITNLDQDRLRRV